MRVLWQCVVWPFPGPKTAGVAICLSVVELTTLACHGSGFWDNEGLSFAARLGLAGLVLLGWTVIAWSGYCYFQLIHIIRECITTRPLQKFFSVFAIVPFVLSINLYVACWIFFWRLGVFPDLDALYFGGLNANMLAKYFWQAERTAWLSYLTGFTLVTAACFLVARQILARCDLQRKSAFVRPAFVLLVGINAAFFSARLANVTSHTSQFPQNRIEAALKPWAPYSFELNYHVNPAVTLVTGLTNDRESEVTGEIPLDILTPVKGTSLAHLSENRRNIVLITIESLRSDAVLKEHQGRQVMPHVAELARSGHFLPNCYANSTRSDYSDPCILSSLYPLRSVRPHYYRREDPWPKELIYDLLKKYGYATAIFSSQNESWSNMHLFYESANLDVFFDSRTYEGETFREKGYFTNWMDKTGQIAGKMDDAVTVTRALDWMRQQDKLHTPFFVSLNLQTSHFPYERPDGKDGPFQPSAIVPGTSLLSYDPRNAHINRNAYYNALAYIDLQMGRLVKFLDTAGLRDQTIILVTGDHGEAFYENGVAGHAGDPVETVLKVGLIINSSGLVAPEHDEYLTQAIDIAPTAVELAGVAVHPAFQGIDVLSHKRPPVEERLVFVHCRRTLTSTDAVISGAGWKYTFDHIRGDPKLFYRPTDLENHPNLYSSETDIVELLSRFLAEWRSRQLLYYQQSRYYNWFYPPRAPKPTAADLAVLSRKPKVK